MQVAKTHSLEEIDHGVFNYKNHESLTSPQLNSIVSSPEAFLGDASGDGGQTAEGTRCSWYQQSGYFTRLTTDNYIEGLWPGLGSSEQQLLNAVDDR